VGHVSGDENDTDAERRREELYKQNRNGPVREWGTDCWSFTVTNRNVPENNGHSRHQIMCDSLNEIARVCLQHDC